jgi:hypothetical protein
MEGRKEGMNRETKAQNKKKNFARNFLFFPSCETEVKYIYRYPKETKKTSLKRNRLSNHIKCPQNTHTPQIHPLSSNATTTETLAKKMRRRPRRSEEREREEATDTGR